MCPEVIFRTETGHAGRREDLNAAHSAAAIELPSPPAGACSCSLECGNSSDQRGVVLGGEQRTPSLSGSMSARAVIAS